MNPGRDSATNQIRRKEPQISTTTNYNRIGTQYHEAKTNRSPTRSEFSGKGDIPNTYLDATSQPVTELAPGKDVSLTSQTVTNLPPHTLEGTSTSKTVLRFPQMNLSGTVESLSTVSLREFQEVSTDISDKEHLLTNFKLDAGADDSSGSSPTTTTVPFISETISHGYVFSSENPEPITYDVLTPESMRNVSEDSASSGSEDSLKDPSIDGSVWFPSTTDVRTQPDVGSGREDFLQTDHTEIHSDRSEKTTESSSPGPQVSQGPSATDMEMPHYSSFAYFPTEVTPHAFTPSSKQHGSVPTVNVAHSQTTQPVYNGETPLQPSSSSEVFPLVTPLLLDSQILNTPAAASSSDSALHATPVSPSVDVSFESILSSYDGATLLPFSSASFSSELFHHLYTVSQILPQVTSAVESDKVSLHASLPVAGGDVQLEPSLAQYSEVVSHQTMTPAASETLEFGGGGAGVLHKAHVFSQVEPSSSDVMTHARSSGPEPSYALSNNAGSQPLLTVSYSSAVPVHDSVNVSRQGSLFSSPSHILMPWSSLITPTTSLLQPTHGFSADGEWSETSSDSEFLLPDTDGLTALNISSSIAEFTYRTSVLGYDNKLLSQSDIIVGNQTELHISSFSEMGYHSESTVMPGLYNNVNGLNASLQESPIFFPNAKDILPGSLAYTTNKPFDHEVSQVPENKFSVQPTHSLLQASGDTPLKHELNINSESASSDPASSAMLSPSTQLLFYEASASFNTELVLLQPSFQASDVGTLLKTALPTVPSDPILVETPKGDQISPTVLHPMAAKSDSSENMLHSTPVPAFDASPASNMPTASLQGSTISDANKKYFEQILLKSRGSQQVAPSLFSNDKLFQTDSLEVNHAIPPKGRQALATPAFSVDGPLNTPINELVYSGEIFDSTKGFIDKEVLAGIPTIVYDTLVTADHSTPLGNVYNSITALSPKEDGSVNTTKLLLPPKTTSELTHSARSDAELVGGDDDDVTDDYDDDDGDRDRNGLSVNKCMVCSSYRESQEKVMNDSDPQENNLVDQNNPNSYPLSEKSEEENKVTGVPSERQTDMDRSLNKSPLTNMLPRKHSDGTQETGIQSGVLFAFTPESKAWAVLTSDEESGSGQSPSDSLNDNETSTDFSFPDVNERDVDGVLEAGDSEMTPGSLESSTPTVTGRHSEVFNISEAG